MKKMKSKIIVEHCAKFFSGEKLNSIISISLAAQFFFKKIQLKANQEKDQCFR